jgi:hypothetical protein
MKIGRNQTVHDTYNERNRHMKITHSILGLTAGAALLLTSGCGKEQPPSGETPQAPSPAASEAQPMAEAAKAAAEQVKTTATAAAEQTAKTVTSQAQTAVAAANTQIQGLIDKAKGLLAEQKYQDALNTLQQLTTFKLSDEQQKLVDGLKAQIQTAMAKATGTNAASALGNILGGKK